MEQVLDGAQVGRSDLAPSNALVRASRRKKRKRNPGGSPDLSSGSARAALPSTAFAGPDRSYPVPDAAHARNALARAAGKPVERRVRAAVKRRYPGIK